MTKYKLLAFFVMIVYFLQSFFLANGGIGADGLSYFGIAADFPRLETNLFPLGYPLLLRGYREVFGDCFWAQKLLNLSMMLLILLFSWRKNFYFRETVLLFTGKTLFYAFNGAISEGPFLFVLYFLLYQLHEFLNDRIKRWNFILFGGFLMLALFSIRYSGVFIYLSCVVFGIAGVSKNPRWPGWKTYLGFLVFSGLLIFAYLGFNYLYFGSFTGEEKRGLPTFHWVYFFRDLMGVVNVVDPFIGIKPASNGFGSLVFQVGLMLVDLLFLRYVIRIFKQEKEKTGSLFHVFLWTATLVYSLSLWVSGWLQQIEEMNVRMLAPANFCIFFSILILCFKRLEREVWIFRISVFFLVFLTAYSLKSPAWYLGYKKQIAAQMPLYTQKKYLYNNEKAEVSRTDYEIPLLHYKFSYAHTNDQQGDIKQSLAGTLNPRIKWLKYDTIPDKKAVLYTSELTLKK